MALPNNRTILYSVILAGLAIILTIPDVLLDFTLSLFHTLFSFFLDLLHTLFEAIEMALDHLVESLFHTDLQKTQLIVFYIMLSLGLSMAYGLLRLLLPFCQRCKNRLVFHWVEEKTFLSQYWLNLSFINKIILASVLSTLAYLFFLVSF